MSTHIHTTITKKTDNTLEELAKTYGTKSRVIEKAVETLLRVDKVGSCEDCAVKTKMNEHVRLRESLDLASVERKTLNMLLEVAIGNKSIESFVNEQKKRSKKHCRNIEKFNRMENSVKL